MPPKTAIVAFVVYTLGIYFHYRGRNLTTDQQAGLEQGIGLLFDAVATTLLYFQALHNANRANIAAHHEVLTTAAVRGTSPIPPPLVLPSIVTTVTDPTKGAP